MQKQQTGTLRKGMPANYHTKAEKKSKMKSSTTSHTKPGKIWVVFDAGASYENTSLNEKLYEGPDLLNILVGTLLRFRQEKYSVMADIEKMFH